MNVFISFDYDRNLKHKKYISSLLQQINNNNVDINDISIDAQNKIDDTDLNDDEIRQIIRDEYLKDSDITIVIVGGDTKNRKFIDWEIYSTIKDYATTSDESTNGNIVVVNCCYSKDKNGSKYIKSWILDKELVNKYDVNTSRSWDSTTKQSIRTEFSFLPIRLLNSIAENFDGELNKKIENNQPNVSVHNEYKHAVFPIIGYDRLLKSDGAEILRLAIRQAVRYIKPNKNKWDLSKLMRQNKEDNDRDTYEQIE